MEKTVKIVNRTNYDDWMELWVDDGMVYSDHISNFTVTHMLAVLSTIGVEVKYKVVYTEEFD